MVHEHQLYNSNGLHTTQPTIHHLVSLVYDTVLNIWMGGMDTWFNWHGGQLSTDNHHRYSSLHKDDSLMQSTFRQEHVTEWHGTQGVRMRKPC